MNLESRVMAALKEAMKAKNKAQLRGLRAIKAAILLKQTDGSNQQLTESDEITLLQKLVKQRKESIEMYEAQGRDDLSKIEHEELEIIQTFLPKQLDRTELKEVIVKIISDLGATSMKEMGKVMGIANAQLKGKADGKTIAAIVKELLA